ncbi:TolC family outer membrane protein [Enterobacteriaceae bacterium BIT-l23]|uniref:TolC family outer membrane protein n=2 Tax=Enterobacteriaceae TaxID=543 RepID=A0A4P8YFK5_9ENTR|nr:TolC family outer membrane protein [Enterobacteriaceae bacterium BIT-l23]QCT18264.1 TolC family outer membrane protein [Jejubacter calystegiae]
MGIHRYCHVGIVCLLMGMMPCYAASESDDIRTIDPQQLKAQQLPALTGQVMEPLRHQPSTPLDINAAVHRAVQWYPDISEEINKLFTQAAKVDVARAKYYPQVNGGFNNGVTNTYTDHGYSPSLVLSISQMLYDFGKVDSSVREANAAVAQQQAMVLLSIDKIAHDAGAALVQVQGYQRLVAIAQEQLAALDKIGVLARQRNSEGASSLSDVVQTEARIEGARATLTQYQASLERWRATLSTYLGWEQTQSVSDVFPRQMDGACQVSHIDDQLVPQVLAAHAQMNQAVAQLDSANAQLLPTISLEPEVTHYLNDRYANSQTLDRTQYSAWVRVQMPLYQGGALTASRDAAQHSVAAATAAVRTAQLEVRQQLSEASNEAVSLQQALLIQARQQALSEKTRTLYQQQYLELGTRPLLDVLNIEQEIFQSRFVEQQTRSQLRSLQLDCLYSTGRTRSAFSLDKQAIQGVEIRS